MNKKNIITIVAVISLYIMAQAIADVGATRLISIAGVTLPGGVFMFAITFTLRDLIHKRLGKEWAKAVILMAALLNILQSAYLLFITTTKAPPFYLHTKSWNEIFTVVPAITIGSIVSEVISQLVDTEVYQLVWDKKPNAPQWVRVLLSNLVALPIDSLIFATLAYVILPPLFGGTATPWVTAIALTGGQILIKSVITVTSLPLIYTIPDKPINTKNITG